MLQDLMRLNPRDCWKPFAPAAGRWTRALVAHAWRRAGFGATAAELAAGERQTPGELATLLVNGSGDDEAREREFASLTETVLATNDADKLAAAWLYRMLRTPHPLREKMTLFWHGHFATGNEKVQNSRLMYNQNKLLRRHALGDFKRLVHGIAKDPAMLIYLDSESNRKAHPNENFAREVMELFVLGEGHYTEKDVRELARCFTGWELRRDRYRFNRYQHDRASKTVLGETGRLTGEQGIDIVLKQDDGPRFICRKLVRFFVCDEPEFPDEYIQPLADQLRQSDWQIAPVLKTIFSSRLFYSEVSVARRVRSPVEMIVGLLRPLEGSTNTNNLSRELRRIGQGLYYPPNVKGWEGGRTWVNSSTLLGRANLVRSLMGNKSTRFGGAALDALLKKHRAGDRPVEWFEEMLFSVPLAESLREELRGVGKSATGSVDERLRKVLHAMSLQPEFQLC